MDLANSTLENDKTAAIDHRKYLCLEARHSKTNETVRKLRSNLSTSIFIPKQPLKSQNKPRTPSSTSPKKLAQQGATSNAKPHQSFNFKPLRDADNTNLHNAQPDINPNALECKQLGQKESRHEMRSELKLGLPPFANSEDGEVLSDQSIESELKSMGLEVSSDTEYFENLLGKQQDMSLNTTTTSSDEILECLSLTEIKIGTKEQNNDKDVLKSTEDISKSIRGKLNRNPFKNALKKIKRNIETQRKKGKLKKRNCSKTPTPQQVNTEFKESKQKCQNYNDALYGVKEFQDILIAISKDAASETDHEINQNRMNLQKSINEFSAFLYQTYRNLEILDVIPSRFKHLSAPEVVVRIEVPNMMEQVITYKAKEILQHSIQNLDMFQKRPAAKKLTLQNSSEPNADIVHTDSVELPEYRKNQRKTSIQEPPIPHRKLRNQSAHTEERSQATTPYPAPVNQCVVAGQQGLNIQETQKDLTLNPTLRNNSPLPRLWNPFTETATHPAFRNQTTLADSKHSPKQQRIIPQQDLLLANRSCAPNATNSSNSTLHEAAKDFQYPHTTSTKHPQTSASAENAENDSPQLENVLRPTVIHQSVPFNIPYPAVQQMTPTETRGFLAALHYFNSNPLLTPPQSIDCQSSPVYWPTPYNKYPAYNQNAIVPITPPSDDIRQEVSCQHQPPPIFPNAQEGWQYTSTYKNIKVSPYMSYLRSALPAPGHFPQ